MSATHVSLAPRVVVDNTDGFLRRPGWGRANRRRDALLWFEPGDKGGFRVMTKGLLFEDAPEFLLGILDKTEDQVRYQVRNCRHVWKEQVVDHLLAVPDPIEGGIVNTHPFRERWNLRGRLPESQFHEIMGLLARAGWVLFRTLFLDPPNPELRTIGERLVEASRESELIMTFMADRFFVPWPMIYSHPVPGEVLDHKGTNYRPEGFWGYRHLLEHKPERVKSPLVVRGRLGQGANGRRLRRRSSLR